MEKEYKGLFVKLHNPTTGAFDWDPVPDEEYFDDPYYLCVKIGNELTPLPIVLRAFNEESEAYKDCLEYVKENKKYKERYK
jgi:hypothetical protein